ncbi:MAG: hypothetical protein QG670_289 [Thermoproteota archaeon]|nr:hypothetical protein [Thermoproteota archaeon]
MKKYGVEVNPLYLMYRTKRLNSFLERTANKNQRFWRWISNIGIVVAVGEIGVAGYTLISNLFNFAYIPQQAQPVFPIIPGVTIGIRWLPYLLLAIGIALTTHELGHGIIAYLEKIPVKSSGIVVAPITFGGFVEPDEEVFNKARLISRLRVLSIGSLTNLSFGFLSLVLIMGLFLPSSGVLIGNLTDGGPAYSAGIKTYDVIKAINGTAINSVYDLSLFMMGTTPGNHLKIETSSGVWDIVTEVNPSNLSRGFIGVEDLSNYYPLRLGEFSSFFSYNIYMFFNWSAFLMVNLAIFNMLPLFPLDGEAYVYSILREKVKKGLTPIRIFINSFCLGLIGLNMILTFLIYGFIQI